MSKKLEVKVLECRAMLTDGNPVQALMKKGKNILVAEEGKEWWVHQSYVILNP